MAISELDLPTGVIAHSSADAQRQAELMADSVAEALRYAVQTHGVASLVVSGGRSPVGFFESCLGESWTGRRSRSAWPTSAGSRQPIRPAMRACCGATFCRMPRMPPG